MQTTIKTWNCDYGIGNVAIIGTDIVVVPPSTFNPLLMGGQL